MFYTYTMQQLSTSRNLLGLFVTIAIIVIIVMLIKSGNESLADYDPISRERALVRLPRIMRSPIDYYVDARNSLSIYNSQNRVIHDSSYRFTLYKHRTQNRFMLKVWFLYANITQQGDGYAVNQSIIQSNSFAGELIT